MLTNKYPGRCSFCKCSIAIGSGVLVDYRRKLVLYCVDHQDKVFTEAQLFARGAAPPGEGDTIRRFADGTVAKWNGGYWWAGM